VTLVYFLLVLWLYGNHICIITKAYSVQIISLNWKNTELMSFAYICFNHFVVALNASVFDALACVTKRASRLIVTLERLTS